LEILSSAPAVPADLALDALRPTDAVVDKISLENCLANAPAAALSNLIPILLIVLFCYPLPQWPVIAVLLAIQLVINGAKLVQAGRLRRAPNSVALRVYEVTLCLSGGIWGALLFPLVDTFGRTLTSTIVYITLFATVAITSMAIAEQRRLFTAFIFGFGGVVSVGIVEHLPTVGFTSFLAILGFIFILDVMTRDSFEQGRKHIHGQLENRWLAEKLAESLKMAEHLANTDSLTGLYNRRAFETTAQTLRRDMATHGKAMQVILLDLDNFKAINDQYGHAIGDRVLQNTARLIKETVSLHNSGCRNDAIFARWGGEEFIILLSLPTVAHAELLAEAIRANLAACHGPDWPDALSLSGSIGIAALHGEDDVFNAINQADKAMYRAKSGGRNRVCIAEESPKRPAAHPQYPAFRGQDVPQPPRKFTH
jgi:diguanylate cyclase (GGDEF)-like protein